MRIARLEVSGFRGFAGPLEFDLDADAVVLVAANGLGKTSLFDAVLWALTGKVQRLGADAALLSRFSESGQMHVAIELTGDPNRVRVDRRYDGSQSSVAMRVGEDSIIRGDAAEGRLQQLLMSGDGNSATETCDILTRTMYLQQDLLCQFVAGDSEVERFNAAASLLGLGDVAALQTQLDRAKTAWTTATNNRSRELEPARQRVRQLEQALADATSGLSADASTAGDEVAAWLREATALDVATSSSPRSDVVVDETLRALQELRRSLDRRMERLNEALASLQDLQVVGEEDIAEASSQAVELGALLADAREKLAAAEQAAAHERARAVQAKDRDEELRTLAQLALRHLGDRCPVCAQDYDHAETRTRLEALVAAPVASSADTLAAATTAVQTAAQRVEQAETEYRDATRRSAELSRIAERNVQVLEDARRLLPPTASSGGPSELREVLQAELSRMTDSRARVGALEAQGEAIAMKVAATFALARRRQLETQLQTQRAELEAAEDDLRSRVAAGDLGTQLLTQVRRAVDKLVAERLGALEPVAQRIYSAIDPHPAFRLVRLFSEVSNRRGRLNPVVVDEVTDVTARDPAAVLSSSQTNALAFSLFLALNLSAQDLNLRSACLDDPLQSLDDVHLLGLVEVLRRLRSSRQVIVSTHDEQFGRLLERKLRPISAHARTRVIRFVEWHRRGPVVEQYDVAADAVPMRLAV